MNRLGLDPLLGVNRLGLDPLLGVNRLRLDPLLGIACRAMIDTRGELVQYLGRLLAAEERAREPGMTPAP